MQLVNLQIRDLRLIRHDHQPLAERCLDGRTIMFQTILAEIRVGAFLDRGQAEAPKILARQANASGGIEGHGKFLVKWRTFMMLRQF